MQRIIKKTGSLCTTVGDSLFTACNAEESWRDVREAAEWNTWLNCWAENIGSNERIGVDGKPHT